MTYFASCVGMNNLSPRTSTDIYDRCERRYAYELEWESKIISPLGLLYRSLEGSLPEALPEEAAKSIALKVMSTMELQVTALDPYAVATHVDFLAGIIATFIRAKLGALMPAPKNQQDGYEWTPGTFDGRPHAGCGIGLSS